jgi:CDP-diacylglycerol--serine O-phosphatidyltransferase
MATSRQLRRGIYILPTLFTVGNLLCGYTSIVHSSLGGLEAAALLILLAAVLDGLDGRIARLTGSTSPFGLQFDSLADVVSFGLAPALLVYHWALGPGRAGWSLAFLYVVCAAMRLARFNIQGAAGDRRYFVGLPSPMAGAVLACVAFAFPDPPDSRWLGSAVALLVFSVAVLMISRFRYRSFREIDVRDRRSYTYVLPLAAVLVAVIVHAQSVVPLLCATYLLSGPTFYLWGLLARGARSSAARAAAADGVEVVDGRAAP